MTKRPVQDEPEPIDAEFEPASGPEPKRARRTGGRPLRSRSATLQETLIGSMLAAVFGAVVAIIVSNASSNAPTGTLAREIDNLERAQSELAERANQAAADVVSLRARLDAQGERLDQQNATEALLRTDLVALTNQLSAISGASDGAAPGDSAAAKSPLGVLLGRINRLEGIVTEDKTAPETTREVQRAIADLANHVAALDLANNTLVTAFDRREAALAALETGMQTMATDISAMRGGKPLPARPTGVAEVAAAPAPLLAARAAFEALLAGARAMDTHFESASPAANAPVLAAMVDVLYAAFLGAETRAVFAYDERLRLLPSFLQQLEMESNGKRVDHEGRALTHPSAAITWGGTGTDAQHAVFQLLHQGTHLVPAEFVMVKTPGHGLGAAHHRQLLANAVAQGAALMRGRTTEEALAMSGGDASLAAAKTFPGNRPSSAIVLETLDPHTLGALIAFYEHRTFTAAVLLGINPFDQWGVELGKEMARAALDGSAGEGFDASSRALLARVL